MSKNEKTPYEEFMAKLSPTARKAMTSSSSNAQKADDEKDEYGLWRKGLSERAREWVDSQVTIEEKPEDSTPDGSARYCCVECENGEFPVVRLFKTPESLVRHIGKLEGQDICVIPFYGTFLKLSKGPFRLLQMPDHETVMTVPRDGIGKIERVEANIVTFDWQDDGFVGPFELANSTLIEDMLEEMAGENEDDEDEDEDEDDEDEEDEELENQPY